MISSKKQSRTLPADREAPRAAPGQLIEADSAARALNILGDRWTLMIISYAFVDVRRFEDFQNRIGIARSLLTDRLRRLVEVGVFRREQYCERPPRFEYRFTEMGRDLYGASLMIIRWEKRWFYDRNIPAHTIRHDCGKVFTPEYRCKACGGVIYARDTYSEPGPGAGFDPAPKSRAQRRSIVDRALPEDSMMQRATDVLGDRWTSHIIAAAFLGHSRFGEFEQALGVASNILADRLSRLVELGVFKQRLYQDKPERWEYKLTQEGLDLFPLVLELVRWGDRWLSTKEGVPRIIYHRPCGHVLEGVITCDQCEGEVTRHSTAI
ncbi:MAG: winged helix-turn-helix transcriptional regulator [Glycocaulis sp.]